MPNLQERAATLRDIRRAIRGEVDTDLTMDELLVAEESVMRIVNRLSALVPLDTRSRFNEIYSACSSGSIDCLDEPLKSDYWFVLCTLQSLLNP